MTGHTFAICAYGDSPFLENCIRSLKAQTAETDIILCTSTPSPYIEMLAAKYEIPVFVRDGKSDIQDDWNFAYEKADSRFVTIAHQDDMYARDYAKTLLEMAEKYPDMTVFTSDYVTVKERTMKKHKGSVEWIKTILRLPLRNPRWNGISQVKKAALIFGNPICCSACSGKKGRFICVERPLIYYRVHGGATTKKWIGDNRRMEEELAMFRKFWPEPAVQLLEHFYKKAYKAYD